MRIAVIADIHGNLPALESVLADIRRRNIDRTITWATVFLARYGHARFAIC